MIFRDETISIAQAPPPPASPHTATLTRAGLGALAERPDALLRGDGHCLSDSANADESPADPAQTADTAFRARNPGPGGICARPEEPGHRLGHFGEEIRARMPTPDEVRTLRLASGVPVIHLIRTAHDTERRAVEVCDTVVAADAYVLAHQLPAT